MSDTEKMNEAMFERLGEIAKFASNKRAELDPDFKSDKSDETQNRLMLAAFRELRSMVEFYKPEEKEPVVPGVYYTPGWLCELAKKLEASSTVPSASSPTGADKAAKTAEYMRRKYSFCDGLFPIRRANCEKAVTEHCWIGGRRFTMEMSEDIHDHGLTHVCCAKIRDNGKLIAKLVVNRGKSMAEHMAHATFKAYVKNLSGSNRLSSRGGFLKAAIKRAAAKQQAHANKAENAN